MKRKESAVLTLEITSEQAGALGAERRKTFGPEGGTIGRLASNQWVLADDYVSNRHARIRFEDLTFFIEDTSTNGVYVNDRRLEKGRPHLVASGDRLFIEPFEIVASIAPSAASNPFEADDSVGLGGADAWRPASPFEGIVPDVVPEPAAGGEVDPLRLLDLEPADPSPAAPRASRARNLRELSDDVLKEHRAAPVVVTPPPERKIGPWALIPEGYDPILDKLAVEGRVAEGPTAERRVRDRRCARDRRAGAKPSLSQAAPVGPGAAGAWERNGSGGGGRDLAAVLAGAGLEGVPVTPELATQFGQILRVVVAGVLDVLQARKQTKGEFRIASTVIQPTLNNPLKHSVDVEDALHNLLLKRNPAYLGPVAAFEDAFNDLRNHQLAMLAGVRVAFEAMFGQFDPGRLQREFDQHTPRARKGALAALQRKPDYWKFYREWVRRMADDADGSFRKLFGEEFAQAYEEQLDRLKTQAPAGGRRPSKGAPER